VSTKPKANTTARGLGHKHQQQVKLLKRRHVEGTPCWWCNEPMYLEQGLHGDHSIPRSQMAGTLADRLLHGHCNIERGDGTRDHVRPAITGYRPDTQVGDDCGRRVMPWPA
jgi:hypothetical protein